MNRAVMTRPKTAKPYASRGSGAGKPCPTCYAPMQTTGKTWTCTKHGEPTKP